MTNASRTWGFLLLAVLLMASSGYAGMDPKGDQVPMKDEVKIAKVGDISMAYRTWGQGEPLVMIMGFSGTMDLWDPRFLENLSSCNRIIIFDNRGMGDTTAPKGNFSIAEFANDTAGLMDALHTEKANVLGWSMGTYVAQEMAIRYPDKIDKLILVSGDCGGEETIMPTQEVLDDLTNTSGSPEVRGERLFKLLFPSEWLSKQPPLYEWFPIPKETSSPDNIERQSQASADWPGTCDRLDKIKSPALVVTGTEDIVTPPENSFLLAHGINGSWLVRFKGAGHGLMYQYPDKLAKIVTDFIEISN